jgi:hypothetical protein
MAMRVSFKRNECALFPRMIPFCARETNSSRPGAVPLCRRIERLDRLIRARRRLTWLTRPRSVEFLQFVFDGLDDQATVTRIAAIRCVLEHLLLLVLGGDTALDGSIARPQ